MVFVPKPPASRLIPLVLAGLALALAGCDRLNHQVLVSGASPPDAGAAANTEPQPINSLPPGAEGLGPPSPTSVQPSFLDLRLPTPF